MTGELFPNDKNLMLTQVVNVDYEPCIFKTQSVFTSFLNSICQGDIELQRYLQKIFGYGKTGETKEQLLFLLQGEGSNGKTTLLQAIAGVMSNYNKHIPINTLLRASSSDTGSRLTPELAQAEKSRILFASEVNENDFFNEAKIKLLTGENVISVRNLYQTNFEYKPIFKVFIDTNHLPRINGTDFAIWRRLKVIPFNATFVKGNVDKNLPEKLRTEYEQRVILNWLVKGARLYYEEGLEDVSSVYNATIEYRKNEDTISSFLNECVVATEGCCCSSSTLYTAYCDYCHSNDQIPENHTVFGTNLKKLKIDKKRTSNGINYLNIALK